VQKADITAALAAALVREQFPQWADLPVVPVGLDGWDNTTFRLGDDLSVRLPSGHGYVAQVGKEHRWLPVLAPHLPLRIPEPVARGRPGSGYPWPWSVYRWIDGEPARPDRIADLPAFAVRVAGFLRALQSVDARGGPAAGAHSAFRGGPVATYDEETRAAIDALAGTLDAAAARRVWHEALAAERSGSPVWLHGDMSPSNLLVAGGELVAVIDFGCCAVGDPACDLAIAWTFFTGASRHAFGATLDLDDATWARARGWALWKALITIHGATGPADALAKAERFGWRTGARELIEELLADR
jgi:aminoglycoside phosphotransferase (APT) family kinase protein